MFHHTVHPFVLRKALLIWTTFLLLLIKYNRLVMCINSALFAEALQTDFSVEPVILYSMLTTCPLIYAFVVAL